MDTVDRATDDVDIPIRIEDAARGTVGVEVERAGRVDLGGAGAGREHGVVGDGDRSGARGQAVVPNDNRGITVNDAKRTVLRGGGPAAGDGERAAAAAIADPQAAVED